MLRRRLGPRAPPALRGRRFCLAFQRVARIADLPEQRGLCVHVGEIEIGLYRVEGEVFAMENLCPHAGAQRAYRHAHSPPSAVATQSTPSMLAIAPGPWV